MGRDLRGAGKSLLERERGSQSWLRYLRPKEGIQDPVLGKAAGRVSGSGTRGVCVCVTIIYWSVFLLEGKGRSRTGREARPW